MTEKSVTKNGAGRADNGNFVVGEFRVKAAPNADAGKAQDVELQNATADFEQTGQGEFPAKDALDGKPKTGWAIAPHMGKPHVAVFETKEDVGLEGGTVLTVVLEQNYGGKHLLGRFRISATTSSKPVKATRLPQNVLPVPATPPPNRPPPPTPEPP